MASQAVEACDRISDVLLAQLQIFIEASDEVDCDQDTIDELVQFVPEDDDLPDSLEPKESGEVTEQPEDDADVDFSALEEFHVEADSAWSKQEVLKMMHNLKERGMSWYIREYVVNQMVPIPRLLYAFGICLCKELRQTSQKTQLYFLRVALTRKLRMRERLTQYSGVDDAVELIRSAKKIVILTGAGISVSCGIPDFRSENGLYAMLKERGEYDLNDPQEMFDIHYFRENPAVFYSFASQIYPSHYTPSPCHRFIKLMEDKGKLLRNYTQNIDTLETLAGVTRVLQCHGSFATASCIQCRVRVPGKEIEDDILNRRVPDCKACAAVRLEALRAKPKKKTKKKRKSNGSCWMEDTSDEEEGLPQRGIMKPDITFFGEKLDDVFEKSLEADREQLDLLIVIGTSLKVAPVADSILHIPHSIPQILINKTPVKHINPDIVLLGNADDVILHLCRKLNWQMPPASLQPHSSRPRPLKRPSSEIEGLGVRSETDSFARRVGNSHVWLFPGADGGKWLERVERDSRESSTLEDSPLSQVSSGSEDEQGDERGNKKVRVG